MRNLPNVEAINAAFSIQSSGQLAFQLSSQLFSGIEPSAPDYKELKDRFDETFANLKQYVSNLEKAMNSG